MKFKYLLATLLVSQFFLFSCKKDVTTPAFKKIEGLWIGTYADARNTPEYFSFIIKPGGSILVESKFRGEQQLAQGTWKLSDTAFSCNYTYFYGTATSKGTEQNATATFDKIHGKLSFGKVQNVYPNTLTATFTMSKVN